MPFLQTREEHEGYIGEMKLNNKLSQFRRTQKSQRDPVRHLSRTSLGLSQCFIRDAVIRNKLMDRLETKK